MQLWTLVPLVKTSPPAQDAHTLLAADVVSRSTCSPATQSSTSAHTRSLVAVGSAAWYRSAEHTVCGVQVAALAAPEKVPAAHAAHSTLLLAVALRVT